MLHVIVTLITSAALLVLVAACLRRHAWRDACRSQLRLIAPRARRIDLVARVSNWPPRLTWPRAIAAPTPVVLATLLDHLARRCASGETLVASLPAAIPAQLRPEFAPLLRSLAQGLSLPEALAAQPHSSPDVALTIHALMLASAGGMVSAGLDRAAATLRERDSVAHERLVNSAQARLSARVLTVLPGCFAVWTFLTSAATHSFFTSKIGAACLLSGCALNVAGWHLMSRAIRGAR